MLTGDKFETAKNIGMSCKLIQKDDTLYELRKKKDVAELCSQLGIERNEKLMQEKKGEPVNIPWVRISLITSEFTTIAKTNTK